MILVSTSEDPGTLSEDYLRAGAESLKILLQVCTRKSVMKLASLLLRGFNHLSRTTFFFSKWWSRADNYHEIFFLIHIKYTLCKCNTFFLIFPSKYWCLTIWFQSMTHSSKRKTLPECIPLPEKHNANSNKKKLKQKNKKIWRFEQKQTLLWNPSYNKQVFLPKCEAANTDLWTNK